jgi:D-hexose-6-phosphate mutarotase
MYKMGNFQSCRVSQLELEKHVNYLKKQNERLQDKLEKIENNTESIQIHKDLQSFILKIDDEQINELIEKIIENDSINFSFIPDEIEKQLYHNVIKLLLAVIQDKI